MENSKKADINDVNKLTNIYEEYRHIFHLAKSNDLKTYLNSIVDSKDSAIFCIVDKDNIIGFAQVNFSYSSIYLGKIAIISDLYVKPTFRKKGFAKILLSEVFDFSIKNGCQNITATSPISNLNSQDLFKKIGMKKDNNYFYYNLTL